MRSWDKDPVQIMALPAQHPSWKRRHFASIREIFMRRLGVHNRSVYVLSESLFAHYFRLWLFWHITSRPFIILATCKAISWSLALD
jgi:hypothetical protein